MIAVMGRGGVIETDERYTPDEVLKPLTKLFGEMYDPCPRNHEGFDGLAISWGGRNCFVNPPYSNIWEWSSKSVRESIEKGAFVAFLIPNDCSTSAFRLLREHSWGRWEIPFRVKFLT